MNTHITHNTDGYQVEITNADQTGPMAVFFADAPSTDGAKQPLSSERSFAARMNLRAAFVTFTQDARWYRAHRVGALFAHLRDLTRGAPRVVLIGQGMGAYGALCAAEQVPAHHVLALSPVATIDPRIGPMDWRFDEDFAEIGGCHSPCEHGAAAYTVVYDPGSAEKRHLSYLGLDDALLQAVPLPCSIGDARNVLEAAGVYPTFLAAILQGSDVDLTDLARQARRSSIPYLHHLATRNMDQRPGVSLWAVRQMREKGARPRLVRRMRARLNTAAPEFMRQA